MASIPICSKVFQMESVRRKHESSSPTIVRNKVLPFQSMLDSAERDSMHFCMEIPSNSTSKVSSEIRGNSGHLKTLDSYFEKMESKSNCKIDLGNQNDSREWQVETSVRPFRSAQSIVNKDEGNDSEVLLKEKKGLDSLDRYFHRLKSGEELQNKVLTMNKKGGGQKSNGMDICPKFDRGDNRSGPFLFGRENDSEECSEPFIVSLLAAINIAVFLFDIASPVRNSSIDDNLSLPLMYGAKINELILDGEWWRLVTPMFLHSGFLHVGLGCWVLFNFGPHVWKGYGSLKSILIYIMGGIAGNLLSFLHTTELTVGGTGPVFALVGAWLVYQYQNMEMIPKQLSNRMFQKAVITTLFILILGNFEHVDDWTHLGAVLTGVVFGYLTCPTMEVDNTSSSKIGQEKGVSVLRRPVGPWISLTIFTILLLVLSSLVFYLVPELSSSISEMDSLDYYSLE